MPFCALMSEVRMLLMRLSDCEENMAARVVQSACVVVIAVTCTNTPLERLLSRYPEHLLIVPDPNWVERVGLGGVLAVLVLARKEAG